MSQPRWESAGTAAPDGTDGSRLRGDQLLFLILLLSFVAASCLTRSFPYGGLVHHNKVSALTSNSEVARRLYWRVKEVGQGSFYAKEISQEIMKWADVSGRRGPRRRRLIGYRFKKSVYPEDPRVSER